MSMNFMTHTFTLFCALLATWALERARRTSRIGWAALSGGVIGVVSLTRPLEGLAVAAVLGLWTLTFPGLRTKIKILAPLTLCTAAVGALVLPYNQYLTGSPTTFPIMHYIDQHHPPGSNSMGFGPEKGLGWTALDPFPGHDLKDILINIDFNVHLLNLEAFGWGAGSLCLRALARVLRTGRNGREAWMLGAIAVVVGLHSFYWYSGGPDFGARYWYLVIGPFLVLTARGVFRLADQLAGPLGDSSQAEASGPRSGGRALCGKPADIRAVASGRQIPQLSKHEAGHPEAGATTRLRVRRRPDSRNGEGLSIGGHLWAAGLVG